MRKRRQTVSVVPKTVPEGGALGNIVLYSGLTLMATGMVITAVGSGDKGFRSKELRLLGPVIILTGLSAALLRSAIQLHTKRKAKIVYSFLLLQNLCLLCVLQ